MLKGFQEAIAIMDILSQSESLLAATSTTLTKDKDTCIDICATSMASLTEQASELKTHLSLSRKRSERCSPIPSPLKLTRLPTTTSWR